MTEEIIEGFSPCAKAPIAGITLTEPSHYLDAGNCEAMLNIGLFFDGTNNNIKTDKPKLGHSNVARLADAYLEDKPNGWYRQYIPGVGTPFPEIGEMGTSTLGSAFAFGCEARVLYGLLAVFNALHQRSFEDQLLFDPAQIKALCRNNRLAFPEDEAPLLALGLGVGLRIPDTDQDGLRVPDINRDGQREDFLKRQATELERKLVDGRPYIKECFIDIFGFSRGAAEARVFCHWLDRLLSGGKLAGVPTRLRFVGLMDTVASAGFLEGVVGSITNTTGGHIGWAEATFLRLPASVENCVHMVSMHELRKNFPLDEIGVDGELPPNCQQCAYPGTHSDVGGGYLPEELGISVGATAMESDALKLAQIPLNHMLECAVAAGVPIDKTLAVADTGHDPFAIAPALQQAYDDFVQISGIGRRPLRDWLQPYLNWRWQMRKNYTSLGHVVKANGGDKTLLIEANARFVRDAGTMRFRGDLDKSKDFLSLFKGRRGPELTDARYRQEELSALDPEALALLDLAQNAPPTPEALARFFDGFVHDSLAGFAKDLVERTGHWRYRKGFRGSNRALFSQRESAGADSEVRV